MGCRARPRDRALGDRRGDVAGLPAESRLVRRMDSRDRSAQGQPVTRRVVVVGAGPNGLVCAARLARAGADVTLLEQMTDGYGGISSAAGPLPGFRHDI